MLYVGDINWVFEYRGGSAHLQGKGYNNYCPVEHMIMEIGKLISGTGENDNNNNAALTLSSMTAQYATIVVTDS